MKRALHHLINLTLIVLISLIGVLIWSTFPDEGHDVAKKQAQVVTERFSSIVTASGRDLNIIVTGATPLERYISQKSLDGDSRLLPLITYINGHASFINQISFKAFSDEPHQCLIVASSQAMDKNRPLAKYREIIGNEIIAWRFVMAHEASHCIRNPNRQIQRLNSTLSTSTTETIAAKYLTESYADVFALLDIAKQDFEAFPEISKRVKDWRRVSLSDPSWNTSIAIEVLEKEIIEKGSKIKDINAQQMDALAWSVVMNSLQVFMERNGMLDNRLYSKFTQLGFLSPFDKD